MAKVTVVFEDTEDEKVTVEVRMEPHKPADVPATFAQAAAAHALAAIGFWNEEAETLFTQYADGTVVKD